jgi:hypothetical protein
MNSWPTTTQVLHDAGLYGDIAKWSDSEAMHRGRLVDAACNLLAMGKVIPGDWKNNHPECDPYTDGYYDFLSHHEVKLIKCAFEVVNTPLKYRGHPDQLVMLDGVRTLIDIKTGGMPKCTALQLASYEMALYSMGEERVIRLGLQLAAGDYKLHFFTDPREKDEWSILVQAWHVRSKYIETEAA